MARQLILMRHAKSSWDQPHLSDFDRPLNGRGKRDAPAMGVWLAERGWAPQQILSSPAKRARKTALAVCEACDIAEREVEWDQALYHAHLDDLLGALAQVDPTIERGMLVGHNPGLEWLLVYLVGKSVTAVGGKVMPTAAVAILEMPLDWSDLSEGCAQLLELMLPRQLQAEY